MKIRDERGVELPLFDERDRRGREDKEAVREAVNAGRLWGAKLTVLDVVAILGGAGSMFVAIVVGDYFFGSLYSSRAVKWAVIAGIVMVSMSLLEGVRRRGAAKRVRAALLKIGRCASCGYSLEGLGVEGDGRVVCAECGGAWGRG